MAAANIATAKWHAYLAFARAMKFDRSSSEYLTLLPMRRDEISPLAVNAHNLRGLMASAAAAALGDMSCGRSGASVAMIGLRDG